MHNLKRNKEIIRNKPPTGGEGPGPPSDVKSPNSMCPWVAVKSKFWNIKLQAAGHFYDGRVFGRLFNTLGATTHSLFLHGQTDLHNQVIYKQEFC